MFNTKMLEFFFISSTLYIGPFWFTMLLNPNSKKTKKLLNNSLFFLGPILIWLIVMLINPSGLIDFAESFNNEDGFLAGLASALSTKAGVTATWAHMVAGDIFATRWIWQKCIKNNVHPIIRFLSILCRKLFNPILFLLAEIFSK